MLQTNNLGSAVGASVTIRVLPPVDFRCLPTSCFLLKQVSSDPGPGSLVR